MSIKIKFQKDFKSDFSDILSKFEGLSVRNKNNFYKEFIKKIEYLLMFPFMYPIVGYKILGKSNYRKIIIKKYIILYTINKDEVLLARIIHQKSKFLNNQD